MRFVKPYILTAVVSLPAVLLFEMIYYPFSPAQLMEDTGVKTVGSVIVLTDETPQELQSSGAAPAALPAELCGKTF